MVYICLSAGYLQVVLRQKRKIAQRTQSDFKSIIFRPMLPAVKWFRYFKLTYTRREYGYEAFRTEAGQTHTHTQMYIFEHLCVCVLTHRGGH